MTGRQSTDIRGRHDAKHTCSGAIPDRQPEARSKTSALGARTDRCVYGIEGRNRDGLAPKLAFVRDGYAVRASRPDQPRRRFSGRGITVGETLRDKRRLAEQSALESADDPAVQGSCMFVVATDVPPMPATWNDWPCGRSPRASPVPGGFNANGSGDYDIAFSTAA